MEQRDELEIETRLRAALLARSELVTHSTLRPGVPPNEHTAGAKARQRRFGLSWRSLLVPVTVAAALAGGVFVGTQLPHGRSGTDSAVSPGASGGVTGAPAKSSAPGTVPNASTSGTTASAQQPFASGTGETTFSTVAFVVADGWQVAQIDDTTACVLPKGRTAPADGTSGLPCGVDALWIKTDAAPDAWPLGTAAKSAGWWPKTVASVSAIACPSAKPESASSVKTSTLLRATAKYPLAAPATAEYHEWAVTCTDGYGARPMLWKVNGSTGSKTPVVAAVSVDPAYDADLIGMVGSLHPVAS